MKKLLTGLALLVAATAARAEWMVIGTSDDFIRYVDVATIQRNGNIVKMLLLADYKTVQMDLGVYYVSEKSESEYDCKERKGRRLAFTRFAGKMGNGKAVYSGRDREWAPIQPGSMGEIQWKLACGKKG